MAHEIRFGDKCNLMCLHLHINKGALQKAEIIPVFLHDPPGASVSASPGPAGTWRSQLPPKAPGFSPGFQLCVGTSVCPWPFWGAPASGCPSSTIAPNLPARWLSLAEASAANIPPPCRGHQSTGPRVLPSSWDSATASARCLLQSQPWDTWTHRAAGDGSYC